MKLQTQLFIGTKFSKSPRVPGRSARKRSCQSREVSESIKVEFVMRSDPKPIGQCRRERAPVRDALTLLHAGEQPAGDAPPRPAVDDRPPGGLPQHVVLGWR